MRQELPATPQPSRLSRAHVFLLLYGALAIGGISMGVYRNDPNIYTSGDRSTPARLLTSPLVGIACGLAVVFLSRLAVHRFEWARMLHREFRGLLGTLSGSEILLLAAASSIGEEIFFRGALLGAIGLFASAIVFATLHVGPGFRYLPWTISAFFMGLLMSGLYLWMGDLGGPIAAHFTINFLNLRHISQHELL
jgi:membrane protease YdiL (CAAX protease family)